MRQSVSVGDMFNSDLTSAFDVVAEDKNNDAGSASGSESSTSEDVSSSGGVSVAGGGGSAPCLHSAMGGAHNGLGFAGQHHISSSVGSEDGAYHGNLHQYVPSELRLGFVDLDFECSTVCSILPGLIGIFQKRLGSWARCKTQKSKSTQPRSQLTASRPCNQT